MKCPECGNEECWRDEVDVGVGIQYGLWNCDNCGWTQRDEVDGLFIDELQRTMPATNFDPRKIFPSSPKPKKYWNGSPITECQYCHKSIEGYFVDGRVQGSNWHILCLSCFRTVGVGLGLGKGQLYDFDTLEKIEG